MPNRRTILKAGCLSLAPWVLGESASASEVPQFHRIKAFIVGADYPSFEKYPCGIGLHNAVKDATTMAESLGRVASHERTIFFEDHSVEVWREKLAMYREQVGAGDFTIFYYAGHAFQSGADLAFLCNDAKNAVSAEQVLRLLLHGTKGVLFIVDACRTPFPKLLQESVSIQKLQVRGVQFDPTIKRVDVDPGVFRPVDPSEMTLPQAHEIDIPVAGKVKFLYSTDGRQTAPDGDIGKGGAFARIAARELAQQAEIEVVVRRIIDKVRKATKGTPQAQMPAEAGDLDFQMYIAGPQNNV